jgi:hypothetical protein
MDPQLCQLKKVVIKKIKVLLNGSSALSIQGFLSGAGLLCEKAAFPAGLPDVSWYNLCTKNWGKYTK